MAKKKKREEDAWLWMSQPVVPGMVNNTFFKYSFTAPEAPEEITVKPLLYPRTGPHGGARWGREPMRAWGYYAGGGLLDPKLPAEGIWWAGALGVGRLAGTAFAAMFGMIVTGTALTILDPHHKWEGGLDETATYQKVEAGLRDPQGFFTGEWPAFSLGALT